MHTIVEIRRTRLAELVEEVGSQAALARLVNKDRNQINQWLGKGQARIMDNDTARMFETVCRKEHGWMDNLSQLERLNGATIRAALKTVREAFGLAVGLPLDVERDPELLASAIRVELARQLREREISDESRHRGRQAGAADSAAGATEDGEASETNRRQRRAG